MAFSAKISALFVKILTATWVGKPEDKRTCRWLWELVIGEATCKCPYFRTGSLDLCWMKSTGAFQPSVMQGHRNETPLCCSPKGFLYLVVQFWNSVILGERCKFSGLCFSLLFSYMLGWQGKWGQDCELTGRTAPGRLPGRRESDDLNPTPLLYQPSAWGPQL